MNPIHSSTNDVAILLPALEPATYAAGAGPSSGAEGSPLVPQPSSDLPVGCSDMAALAVLLARADQSDRKSARRTEDVADQAQAKEDTDRVNAMLDKAQQDLYASVAQGALEIAGGASTALIGATDDPKDSWQANALRGGAQAAPGIGALAAAPFRHDAENDDATAARDQAGSAADARAAQQAHEDVQAANESLKKVEDFLQAVQQARNTAEQAAATVR